MSDAIEVDAFGRYRVIKTTTFSRVEASLDIEAVRAVVKAYMLRECGDMVELGELLRGKEE